MTHCELWLEMKGKSFRVALLVPKEVEVAEGYLECEGYEHPSGKGMFVTEWFDGIHAARDKMDKTAQFYNDNGVKFLFFREIRQPLCRN